MATKLPQILIQELLNRGLISEEKLSLSQQQALEKNRDFGQILVEAGLIKDEELLRIKSEIYQLPAADLTQVEVDKNLSQEIAEDVISFYQFIPFFKKEKTLGVGIINPEDLNALEALKFIGEDRGLNVEKYVISYGDFDRLEQSYSSITFEVGELLRPMTEDQSRGKLEMPASGDLEEITVDSPITKVVAIIVKHAVENKASDIHIEPFEKQIRVRFRIDGVLQAALSLPRNLLSAITTRVKILSEMKIDETRLPQDGRFSTFLDRKIDFRVSILPTRHGEKIVMRILDPMVGNIDLPQLGLFGHALDSVLKAIDEPVGEILITGPTGSGKSTTLYALLRRFNNEGINVITLEDPIEYYIEGVNQSQVHEEIGYSFANGLRSILRQDPDVIMVGEIRDRETASLATNAALTGHTVLSTLHTNDAIGVIPRLVDMGVEKYLIAPTLNLAIAQRLLRKLCDSCKIKAKPNAGEKKIIDETVAALPPLYKKDLPAAVDSIYKPAEGGCKECGGKAYHGRMAIFEILEMTDELEKVILEDLSEAKIRAEAKRQQMITMFQDGIIKVLKGITSMEELLQVAEEEQN